MGDLPSLRQLSYLIALAEHLNFTRAAASCFVTQSTLSAGLKELEATLGASLVERDRQSVLMTPLGHEVVGRARHLLALANDLAALAAAAAEPMSGTLRLGAIPTIAPFLFPRVLPGLRTRYPKLKLLLREDVSANLLQRLAKGQLDFALLALPYDAGDMLVRELFDDEFWLVGREDDAELRAKHATVTAPVAEKLVLLEEGHCLRQHTLAACARDELSNASGVEATSLLTLVQMVESGIGLALVPELALTGGLLKGTRLVARPLIPPAPKRCIALLARRSSARQSEWAALGDFIEATRTRDHYAVTTSRGRRNPTR
ncbi:MAG: hydrogen peroxide-inducible genes activator [Betaproteobacteria bacterium]|nr:MAG: hydrogen peroxide-inducible genes activator [Betaproteobacteria bacterium]